MLFILETVHNKHTNKSWNRSNNNRIKSSNKDRNGLHRKIPEIHHTHRTISGNNDKSAYNIYFNNGPDNIFNASKCI
jgi:hypothetical protein